jgi:hypothetical protein
MQGHLTTLKTATDSATLVLALGTATRGLSLARALTTSNAERLLARAWGRLQITELVGHNYFLSE